MKFSVWHQLDPKAHTEANRTEIKCTAPMNHLTLELKPSHQFIIHSCAALKLRLKSYNGIDSQYLSAIHFTEGTNLSYDSKNIPMTVIASLYELE